MPSPRKRIGFLPRSEVQTLIDKICLHNKLSQSKVTSILVEEALSNRGVLNINPFNSLLFNFHNDNKNNKGHNQGMLYGNEYIYDKNLKPREFFNNEDINMIKEFIEYKYFKKLMNQNKTLFN